MVYNESIDETEGDNMDGQQLANAAIKNLNGDYSDKSIRRAVLYACTTSPDLVPQSTIEEAVARIRRGVAMANEAMGKQHA